MSDDELFGDLVPQIPDNGKTSGPITAEMTESEMCSALAISSARLRTLARDGICIRTRPGRYDFWKSLHNYLARLRLHAERAGRPSAGGDDLRAEKLRLMKAQAEREETKNAALRGELIEVEAVTREWQAVLRDVRAAMLAVPSRFGADHPHLTPNDISDLNSEIKNGLEGLADGKD
ncbi:terminase small subunit [Martelella radicis]|uniref:Phage terminase Nu1 subunit (DNA packaging protein) n=1 Tax=Martelella radicis TaxID=1397476 RepID=A0A7W6P7I1_9HYPH|nr:terminase small subunit [Martelella radicis]MBB4120217.1 phage terminase Nu1 subunit (DNA packaging protein) [Martelella radicis]